VDQSNDNQWPLDLPRSGKDPLSFAIDFLRPDIFREYDLRGTIAPEAPDETHSLNSFVANRLGRAFGTFLQSADVDEVVVGHDSRSYSEPLATALTIGLLSTGLTVRFIGLATSPMVYYAQHALGGIAATAVTASHNPNGWAGFKLADQPSVTLGPEAIAELRSIAEGRAFKTGTGTYSEAIILPRYVDEVVSRVGSTRPLHIVLDGGNSIAGPVAERVLEKAGHKVTTINLELDWTFPNHEPDPESVLARNQIAEAVVKEGADLGISIDGDGDRLGITDEKGTIVWSDIVLALMAVDSLSRHPGSKIVYDVKCSRAVADVIHAAGGEPIMWKTGHSHIKAKAREVGAPFSGERSGHFFDAGDYYGYDDAIYAGLRFADIVATSGKTVSELVAQLPHYESTPTMHTHCADEVKYDTVERFRDFASNVAGVTEIIDVNGVRAEFEDGWFLVRASSNLPALVVVVEATSAERLRELYDIVRNGLLRQDAVSDDWENDPFAHAEQSVTH
jgi:phosphomannomutase/phosphoglucomutase